MGLKQCKDCKYDIGSKLLCNYITGDPHTKPRTKNGVCPYYRFEHKKHFKVQQFTSVLYVIMSIALPILRSFEIIEWYWLWVFTPILIPIVLFILILLIAIILAKYDGI